MNLTYAMDDAKRDARRGKTRKLDVEPGGESDVVRAGVPWQKSRGARLYHEPPDGSGRVSERRGVVLVRSPGNRCFLWSWS